MVKCSIEPRETAVFHDKSLKGSSIRTITFTLHKVIFYIVKYKIKKKDGYSFEVKRMRDCTEKEGM